MDLISAIFSHSFMWHRVYMRLQSLQSVLMPFLTPPGGVGRNMSLFCVMKRYDLPLDSYLSQHTSLSSRTSLLLLSQLLEALLHLSQHNISHRYSQHLFDEYLIANYRTNRYLVIISVEVFLLKKLIHFYHEYIHQLTIKLTLNEVFWLLFIVT